MALVGRKKIARKKPTDTSPRKIYFDENTQKAIVAYQEEPESDKKNEIYTSEINPAFDALVENLINVYKFQAAHESKDDLKHACIEDLYKVLGKYDHTRASKAFSYFNVIAKHWLIIRSKQSAKNTQSFVSIDNKEAFSPHELELIENHSVIPSCDEVVTQDEFKNSIQELMSKLFGKCKTVNEQLCVDAIKVLLSDIEDVDLINKRAVMAYMREITKLSPKQLSVVLSSLKKHYKDIRRTGEIVL